MLAIDTTNPWWNVMDLHHHCLGYGQESFYWTNVPLVGPLGVAPRLRRVKAVRAVYRHPGPECLSCGPSTLTETSIRLSTCCLSTASSVPAAIVLRYCYLERDSGFEPEPLAWKATMLAVKHQSRMEPRYGIEPSLRFTKAAFPPGNCPGTTRYSVFSWRETRELNSAAAVLEAAPSPACVSHEHPSSLVLQKQNGRPSLDDRPKNAA